jgi:hypothetical protein
MCVVGSLSLSSAKNYVLIPAPLLAFFHTLPQGMRAPALWPIFGPFSVPSTWLFHVSSIHGSVLGTLQSHLSVKYMILSPLSLSYT